VETENKAIDVLAEQIISAVSACLENAPFDKTKQGIVTASLGSNKYSVRIEGTVFTVPSCTATTYSVNDNVLVLYVQNDAKRKYIIGKAVS